MKKVVLASLLAVAGAGLLAHTGFSQQPAGQAAAGAPGQIQMSQEEYAAYNNANTQTTPTAKAAAFEAYLKAYPQSSVKNDVLAQIMFAYYQANDPVKLLAAADAVLASDPNNLAAYVFEAQLRVGTDANAAADYAQKGLALGQPKGLPDQTFATIKASGYPVFYSVIGVAALNKKDTAGAIAAFKSELAAVPVAQTTTPGQQLQDTFNLGQAYYISTPPDYLNCAYYTGRAMFYAPEPYKSQFRTTAIYCYHKYHGPNDEGFDAMVAVAKDNLNPPATLHVVPAPKPSDIVANLIATTPDLAALAISDKEYVIANGRPAVAAVAATDTTPAVEARPSDADKLFDTIKGKSVEIPDALVIAATADQVQVAVSEDSVQNKVADFAFNFSTPLKVVPAVGDKITLSGTYASYTQTPLMITMSDSAVVVKKPPVKKPTTPVHHPVHKS